MSKEKIRAVIGRVLWTAGATESNRELLAGAIFESLAAPSVASAAPTVKSIDCEDFRKLADAYHCCTKQDLVEPTYDALFQYVDREIERQVHAAVLAERAACAEACMRATPDRSSMLAIGEAAHYFACRDAIRARN